MYNNRGLKNLLLRFDRVRCWKESVLWTTELNQISDTNSASSPDSVVDIEAAEIDLSFRDTNSALHDENVIDGAIFENLSTDRVSIDQAGSSQENQIASDFQMILSIYRKLMNEQNFVWPRLFEAAAAINRIRGTQF